MSHQAPTAFSGHFQLTTLYDSRQAAVNHVTRAYVISCLWYTASGRGRGRWRWMGVGWGEIPNADMLSTTHLRKTTIYLYYTVGEHGTDGLETAHMFKLTWRGIYRKTCAELNTCVSVYTYPSTCAYLYGGLYTHISIYIYIYLCLYAYVYTVYIYKYYYMTSSFPKCAEHHSKKEWPCNTNSKFDYYVLEKSFSHMNKFICTY